MLNINNGSQPLPPMPTISHPQQQQPAAALPAHSPYAARSSPEPFPASASASTTQLLTPAHFASPAAAAPLSSSSSPPASNSAASSAAAGPVRSRADFEHYVQWLVRDPATLDWLYKKHAANPQAHPFT